jgi:DNA-binding GntR family transcriptional regulator
MATQTGAPAEQWLQLKVGQLIELQPGDPLPFGTKGKSVIPAHVTDLLFSSFQRYLAAGNCEPSDYVFKSRKGNRPLTLSSVSRLVKSWMKANGIEATSSLLTLRKIHTLHVIGSEASPKGITSEAEAEDYLRPIRVPTRQEMVYKELETAILSGHIHPGTRIVSEEIAKKLDVSVIPIREALRRLEAVGLVANRPNYGVTVAELSKENLEEILEIRIHLEGLAASKAAKVGDEKLVQRLTDLHQQYAQARATNKTEDLLDHNKRFHHTLYEAAGMPILLGMIEKLWDRVSPYYYILFRQSVKPNPVIGISYHQEMINAVKRHQPETVAKWVEADLTDTTHFVLSLFNQSQAGDEGG